MSDVGRLIESADLDGLVRAVDGRCAARDWDGLVALRDRCLAAVERGKQLWGVAAHADYRLALEAPAPFAAAVVAERESRFTLGPLAEVAASTHTWEALAPHLPAVPAAGWCAHERVVRGERLTGAGRAGIPTGVLELPLALQEWEPAYQLAEYDAHEARFPAPPLPARAPAQEELPAAVRADDPLAESALRELVGPWVQQSNGRAEAVAVEGSAAAAVGALGLRQAALTPLAGDEALAHMAWAAASGGAHGNRRGAAAGRFGAWWALAAVAGLVDDWPVPADDMGAALAELRWWWWDTGEPDTGWNLRLAVEDPQHGLGWALVANDVRFE